MRKWILFFLLMGFLQVGQAQYIMPIPEDSVDYEDGFDPEELERILRTSSDPESRGTARRDNTQPPDGDRIGCICMDGSKQDMRGRGACSGYGGVRFWLYELFDHPDSVVLYATKRHREHPEALDKRELMALSSYQERNVPAKSTTITPWYGQSEQAYMLTLVVVTFFLAVTLMVIIRILFRNP
ncbi:hypothetical protein [Algivirga pacifica]